ncbi:MAG TPA: DUF6445 family protein [Rudaea sp.]|jgi:hypothetical protein
MASTQQLIAFNPRPRIERIELIPGQACLVIDDALLEPQRLVDFAAAQSDAFGRVDFNAYPGILLPTPGMISGALSAFFVEHVRRLFDARRVLRMHSRLALVTLPPEELQPWQCICHADHLETDPRLSIQASVLYLFKDALLGGTSFYDPLLSPREIAQMFHDAGTMPPADFTRRHGIAPGYLCDSNRYFRRVGGVDAKWNRLIFYDGAMLHSGDIRAPHRLSADPRRGRLTLNAFFTSRRRAA